MGEELVVLFGEQGELAAGADMHRRVEAGVLTAGAALGGGLVLKLVLDLDLAGLADSAEVQGDGHLAGLAVIHHAGGDLRQGVTDLAGEGAAVQLFEELGSIGWGGHCFDSLG